MARATLAGWREVGSDDELPDLATLFPAPNDNGVRRRSPRKASEEGNGDQRGLVSVGPVAKVGRAGSPSPSKRLAAGKRSLADVGSSTKAPVACLGDVPDLSRYGSRGSASASSNNGVAWSSARGSLGLTHVDSLLLPLSKVCLGRDEGPGGRERGVNLKNGCTLGDRRGKLSVMGSITEATGKGSSKQKHGRSRTAIQQGRAKVRHFVLEEAGCDGGDSADEEVEDEETDLSGFVVDDDADLSIHISSSDSDSDVGSRKTRVKPDASPRRRRLQRGPPKTRGNLESDTEDSNKENGGRVSLLSVFRDMKIDDKKEKVSSEHSEVIDLTSPSTAKQGTHINTSSSEVKCSMDSKRPSDGANIFDDFDAILKFSPPRSYAPISILKKSKTTSGSSPTKNTKPGMNKLSKIDGFTTPPTTPPRSPSKLNSPSKLLSPSKKAGQVPKSPHRQSVAAFWDLEVINTWNDTYSPKKAPLTSPKKSLFMIWSDSDDDDDDDEAANGICNDSSGSIPSPCSSPRKPRSPLKSPEKAEKKRLVEEKRAAAAKKKEYEMKKEQLAEALMRDLDANITDSKLSTLSATTGGVQIIWSNTLRSTAGRANWRRTVTKPSGSPVKSDSSSAPEGCKVQHYASIELASKVIDSEFRLVNTLAHEFCHLANFMVSNVRDQPHGVSFKNWAAKVTKYLRTHEEVIYRSVEVTTKHSYAINHKYLWNCAGRDQTDTMAFLNIPADGGCGAEYGRHSKSIDVDKHRCGRCKGMLVQVRPKPRKVEKRLSPRKGGLFQKSEMGFDVVDAVRKSMEVVELND